MKHTEGKFKGRKDFDLYYQSWLPDGAPRAILLVVHGLAEHSGRYMNLVNRFVPLGYAVYSFDQRGHGKSEGLRGHVERFSYYLNDLRAFLDMVRSEHPDAKIFLVGHSMGGTVAIAYSVHHQDELDGLILSGAILKVDASLSPMLIMVGKALSVVLPKSGVMVLDASAISQDQAVVDAYVNDPLVYRGKIRARLGAELMRMTQELPGQTPRIVLPILIMHGTADRLCDPEGSVAVCGQVGSNDKTLKLYDGFYHEIFNEPGREQAFADMEVWLAART